MLSLFFWNMLYERVQSQKMRGKKQKVLILIFLEYALRVKATTPISQDDVKS